MMFRFLHHLYTLPLALRNVYATLHFMQRLHKMQLRFLSTCHTAHLLRLTGTKINSKQQRTEEAAA